MRRERSPCVYIMASAPNGTLYTGVTSDLIARIHQHREGTLGGFTSQHACKRLVFHEFHEAMADAIVREKRIKAWRREWKLNLIERDNPGWLDLAIDLGFTELSF